MGEKIEPTPQPQEEPKMNSGSGKLQYEIMAFEEYAEKQHNPIYVYEIKFDDKRITFFGSEHSYQPEKPMFKDIETKFKEANPQIVFVEGMHFGEDQKEQLIEEMKKADTEEVIKKWGESGFAFKLAANARVDVESPEPDLKEEIQYLLEQRFTKEEIFAYYGYRQANSYHLMSKETPIEEYLTSFIKYFKKDTNWNDFNYSIDHLKQIGKRIWDKRGDLSKKDELRTNPVPYKSKRGKFNNINRISQQSSYFRDRFMIQKIEEAMKKNDRLFIVFGSTHAFMQEPTLRKLFEKK